VLGIFPGSEMLHRKHLKECHQIWRCRVLRLRQVVIVLIVVLVGVAAAVAENPAHAGPAASSTPAAMASPGDSSMAEPAPPAKLAVSSATAGSSLHLGKGDLLEVSVFGVQDYDNQVRVAEDGSLTLPLIGTMQAAGKTSPELAGEVRAKLMEGGFFKDPQVAVFVKEYATQGISVMGEVNKPGIYQLLGPHTLFDAISAAQGTTQTAGDTATITHRGGQNPETVKLIYEKNGIEKSDVPVYPGDTVVVQKAGTTYIIGAVTKPTEIVMANPNLTVLQALAIAQGPTPDASLNKAKLIRVTNGVRHETPLRLKKMLTGKSSDVKLEANDIVFVPGNITKTAAKKGLQAAISTLTGIATYGRF
jgi:polysaccharide biosynthesis/export protein